MNSHRDVKETKFIKLAFAFICMVLLLTVSTEGREQMKSPVKKSAKSNGEEYLVYIGTYTGEKSKGIYACRMNLSSGELVPLGLVAETSNPTFLDIDQKRGLLFAVNEVSKHQGKAAGAISSFAIDRKTGTLKFLSQESTMGTGPCHVVLQGNASNALVANYGSGSVALLPIGKRGPLNECSAFVQHEGKSVNPKRQAGPHAHCVTLDSQGKFAFVCDLGLDKILIYEVDAKKHQLVPGNPAFVRIHPGSGPRHLAFSPKGKHAYLVNELDSTVVAFAYDPKKGMLKELQTISALPPDFKRTSYGAEIEVHPSGKFVYASNRGHDSIAVFEVDRKSGKLSPVQHQSTLGKTPRHFKIDPTGKYLLAANQDTDNIVVFKIDEKSGKLTPTGTVVEVPTPVCVQFFR